MSSKDTKQTHVMHHESDNIEIMIDNKTNEIIKELFESVLSRYQIDLEESMRGNGFAFDCIDLLYCKFHRISLMQNALNRQ